MGHHFKMIAIYTAENDSLASFTFSRIIFFSSVLLIGDCFQRLG